MLKVESNFSPKGDQPKAIKQLVEGLEAGYRFQTLLGATGTGKSVAFDEIVTVELEPGNFWRGKIGQLIDSVLGNEQTAESLEMPPPERWRVLAWDAKSGQVDWKEITGLSRHRSPAKMYKLSTNCGRKVTITDDHSVWVLRNGQLHLINGSKVQKNDALPIPRFISEPNKPLKNLNLTLAMSPVSVKINKDVENLIRSENNEDFQEFELSLELAFILGQYIAHGQTTESFVLLQNQPAEVQQKLIYCLKNCDIPFLRHQNGDFVISPPFTDLFKAIGQKIEARQLPNFWPNLKNTTLAAVLAGYFENNAEISRGAITSIVINEQLAFDLAEALLRFGIWAWVREIENPDLKQKSQNAYKISIFDHQDLENFQHSIGFISHKKAKLLAENIKIAKANIDFVYGVGARLAEERKKLKLSQEKLAELVGCNLETIQTIEIGKKNPSKKLFTLLYQALKIKDQAFLGLSKVIWSQIDKIEEVESQSTHVYDFSVDGFETFLTGSGGLFVHNTYTVAKTIEAINRPALIIAPNKILAAQLAGEFRDFFPSAAVEFFISYYDYYQPEAYVPGKDLFIEKDAAINEEIDRLRHSTTRSLLTRSDVIVVASVSCIYGLGNPEEYKKMNFWLEVGGRIDREKILERLIEIQYERNDFDLSPGKIRAKGEVVEIWPAYDEFPLRIELFGDEIDRISVFDYVSGDIKEEFKQTIIYPAKHYLVEQANLQQAIQNIELELTEQLKYFESVGKYLEAQRLRERTFYDIEMMRVLGHCPGIENYSRHLENREAGSRPYTLLDYFPNDFITFLDESHITHSQIGGMYRGDYNRKKTLADYGFRLPSCIDNRPMTSEEFYDVVGQVIYVSATPGTHERTVSSLIVDQVIRPTGLLDPHVEIRPTKGQVEDLLGAIRARAERDERVLVTTLTKRMAEDLTEYFVGYGIKARYLHSDIDTIERQEIIRDLRLGHFDVLIGINLLREGLDLPEVSLVAILDADKPGFLRSERSLIQTIGRAARNVGGQVFLYADAVTPAMEYAMNETNRRRNIQEKYNQEHGITPQTVSKSIRKVIRGEEVVVETTEIELTDREEMKERLGELELEMWQASEELDFERAANLRDEIRKLEAKLSGQEVKMTNFPAKKKREKGRKR